VPQASWPPQATPYRTVGPWEASEIPQGLLTEHRLKPGTWARLQILRGSVRFVWDDGASEAIVLCHGTHDIPPEIPHHLELIGDVRLQVTFWK
jgi:tellurite resistance-related uncharacterized protein